MPKYTSNQIILLDCIILSPDDIVHRKDNHIHVLYIQYILSHDKWGQYGYRRIILPCNWLPTTTPKQIVSCKGLQFISVHMDNCVFDLTPRTINRIRKVWRCQKGSQKPQIDEGQTIQWQMKKDKRTNNDLQNDRATRTPLKPMMNSWALDEFISSCSTRDTRRVIVKRHEHHLMTFRIIM